MKKILLLFVVMTLSGSLFAAGWTPAPGQKISGIIVEGSDTSGTALIIIDGGVPAANLPSECSSIYNKVSLETERGRGMLAVALAAKLADKPVRLALGACDGTRPLITNIWL